MEFNNTQVFNFEGAIKGMRNPKESWQRSDSHWENGKYVVGERDLRLMRSLIKGGSEHRKFLRQIFISVDITAPSYWWQELDTYKIGVTRDSTSMQHKGTAHEYTLNDFELDQVSGKDWQWALNLLTWEGLLNSLNSLREQYLETNDYNYFRAIRQLMPMSYKYTSTVTMNYENLWNMYKQRKNHKLKEWSEDFVAWCESLPYFKELFLNED